MPPPNNSDPNNEKNPGMNSEDIKRQIEQARQIGAMEAEIKAIKSDMGSVKLEIKGVRSSLENIQQTMNNVQQSIGRVDQGFTPQLGERVSSIEEKLQPLWVDYHARQGRSSFFDRMGIQAPLWMFIIGVLGFALFAWLESKGVQITPPSGGHPGA